MTLTPDALTGLLDRLIADCESEVVEFKQASQQYDRDKTSQYVSALSNEANLRGASAGWLMFGVSDDRRVVGTAHLNDVEQRQSLKHDIHQSIDQGLTIRDVHEVRHSGHRVVLLEIPPAPRGIPISWKGNYRARARESLVPLSLDKVDTRNVQLRLMPPNELIYREISKYDERSLLEALYNCIAHQDYTKRSRIIVTEHTDCVEFISVGEFFDGSPEEYVLEQRTPRDYRNPLLLAAMTELNLIDHMGYGIHRMVQDQVRRFLPPPDYDLDTPGEVKLTIPRAVIDESYSQLLMVRADLPLEDVLALDRVQKGLDISPEAVKRLRKAKLIEGRKPHSGICINSRRHGEARRLRAHSASDGRSLRDAASGLPRTQWRVVTCRYRRSLDSAAARGADGPAEAQQGIQLTCQAPPRGVHSERRKPRPAAVGTYIDSCFKAVVYARSFAPCAGDPLLAPGPLG